MTALALSELADLFVSAERVGGVLAGGLGAIAVAERRHLRVLSRRVLFLQWRTWAVAGPIYLVAVTWSRWTTLGLALALALVASHEYARMVGLPRAYRLALMVAGALTLLSVALAPGCSLALASTLLIAACALPIATQDTTEGPRHLAYGILGYLLIPTMLTNLVLIRDQGVDGSGVLVGLGGAVALSDVLASVVGRLVGRHSFLPRVSPNKTWEGLVGNVGGAILGWGLMSSGLPSELSAAAGVSLPLVIAVGAVSGDLMESLLKRHCGAKDAGRSLPGFGGLLDRIDSLLFALPLTYLALMTLS